MQWMKRARAVAIAAAFAGPFAVGSSSCVLGGFDVAREDPPKPPDACEHAIPPRVPADAAAGGDVEFVVSLYSIDLGEQSPESAPPLFGLDLDGACTCQGEAPTCQPRSAASNVDSCDGPGGRDMGTVQAFKALNIIASTSVGELFTSRSFTEDVQKGDWSLLLRVSEYNGQSNDDQVTLTWYIAPRFELQGGLPSPEWMGDDVWPISEDSFNGEEPKFRDLNAYVVADVLVAALPEAELILAGTVGSSFSMTLSGGILMAKVTAMPDVGGGYALREGILSGRLSEPEMFRTILSIHGPRDELACRGSLLYDVAKSVFCASMDINITSGLSTRSCDALSIGFGFDTRPARLGDPRQPTPPENACASGYDPLLDRCPSD